MRESRTLGSVGAKAEWLSYPTATAAPGMTHGRQQGDEPEDSHRGENTLRILDHKPASPCFCFLT